jgi:uncharacterized protein (DUF2141 family)
MKNSTFALISLFFLYGCAKIASPTGGPKDTTPPGVVSSYPVNKSVNVTGRTITIEFDEYVRLVEPGNNIIISPTPGKNPDISLKKGKILEIEFQNYLQQNTTYAINFGDAIVDNNEGNPMGEKQLIFSTGPVLDSLTLSGSIINNNTGKPAVVANVYLYSIDSTPDPSKQTPLYFTRTDSSGHFHFQNLPDQAFYVSAHTDLNSNKRIDRDEAQTAVYTQSSNSTEDTRFLFQPLPRFRLHSVFSNGLLVMSPVASTDSIQVILDPVSASGKVSHRFFPTPDSTYLIIEKPLDKQKITLIHGKDTIIDSLTDQSTFKNRLVQSSFNDSSLLLEYLLPINKVTKDSISVKLHSFEFSLLPIDIKPKTISIPLPLDEEQYPVQIATDPNQFLTNPILGNQKDTLRLNRLPLTGYGTLQFGSNQTDSLGTIYWVLEGNNTKQSGLLTTQHELTLLKAGTYQLYFFLDRNGNGRFDPYYSSSNNQPDLLYKPKTSIQIKPNWTQNLGIIQFPVWFSE